MFLNKCHGKKDGLTSRNICVDTDEELLGSSKFNMHVFKSWIGQTHDMKFYEGLKVL